MELGSFVRFCPLATKLLQYRDCPLSAKSGHRSDVLLFREQESHKKPGTEILGSDIIGAGKPIPRPAANLHRLIANSHQLGDRGIDRHRPFVCNPVVGAFCIKREGPCILGGVGHEWLEERATGVVAVTVASISPEVVREHAVGPTVVLPEHDASWSCSKFSTSQQTVRRGRKLHRGANTPNDATRTRSLRRKEQALQRVSKTKLMASAGRNFVLIYDWQDRT